MKNIGTFKDFSDDSLKLFFDIEDNKIIEMTLLMTNQEADVVNIVINASSTIEEMIGEEILLEGLKQTLTKQTSNTIERRTEKKELIISFEENKNFSLKSELEEMVHKLDSKIK